MPWSFDPKTSVTFLMQPTSDASALVQKKAIVFGGIASVIVMLVFAMVFAIVGLAVVGNFGVIGYLFLLVPIGIFVFWFATIALPKWVLGQIKCELSSTTFQAGEMVGGELVVQPRKDVRVNAITIDLTAKERCVSGSGSNRKTHHHEVYKQTQTLAQAISLVGDQENRFAMELALPPDAPLSLALESNELIWSVDLRIDLPRWPDWRQSLPMRVVPMKEASTDSSLSNATSTQPPADETEITFAETVQHLKAVYDDRQSVMTLVEAVTGMTFDIEAEIERRLLYAGDDDPHVHRDGFAVWARSADPSSPTVSLPMVLYVPHALGDEFEQAGRGIWRGRGTIVGWDSLHGRLQVKVG